MRTNTVKTKTIVSFAMLLLLATTFGMGSAQAAADTLSLSTMEKMIHRRAIETAVWAIPGTNYMAMREGYFNETKGTFNDVFYNSKIQTWRLQTTTNNNTTPYVMAFWNLEKDGPVVIEIPKSEKDVGIGFGTLLDAWQRPLEDVGVNGKDQGRGAKYLILPPNYEGPFVNGYINLEQRSNNGYTLLRPLIENASPENLKKAAAFVKKIQIYPLSQAANPPKTKHIDVWNKNIDGVPHYNADYFTALNKLIQEEVVEEKDKAMMGLLKEIGIEKGKAFKVDERRGQILDDAAKEAHSYMIERYFNSGLTVAFWGDKRNWTVLTAQASLDTDWLFEFPSYLDIDARVCFYAFFTSAKHWSLFDAPTMYLLSNKDQNKQQLNGSNHYKLTIPKNVPIKHFWSVIAHNINNATWFDNQPKAGVASSDEGVKTNSDGTFDIYFGPKAPKGKEANWVPTTEGIDYFLYFRLYGPKTAFFTKQWMLNDVEKMDQ
jgi:hypothetical protein